MLDKCYRKIIDSLPSHKCFVMERTSWQCSAATLFVFALMMKQFSAGELEKLEGKNGGVFPKIVFHVFSFS